MVTRAIGSWGGLERRPHEWIALANRREVTATISRSPLPGLVFGNGRSYGDACLNAGGTLWGARGLDRFIDFDADSGEVTCEAGVLLSEIIDLVLPSGWFLPVVPGTSFVTVGGAVANDVHGKNHHSAGTFGEHVVSLQLTRTDGRRIRCAPDENSDYLAATIGGLGLTGVIESAQIRLRRVPGEWIEVESQSFESLDEFLALSEKAKDAWEYTVAWIDCGPGGRGEARGVLFSGNHAAADQPAPPHRDRGVPFDLPFSLVSEPSVRAFNALYGRLHRGRKGGLQHYRPFFFPLDSVRDWNRIYGRSGFYQYQCVVPVKEQVAATRALLKTVSAQGSASFLAVLKTFGPRPSAGLLSFPMAGTTLALDFPNRNADTLRLFEELDAIVSSAGGRLYPAKDARMSETLFKNSYPRWQEFVAYRDPGISSQMSRRLLGS